MNSTFEGLKHRITSLYEAQDWLFSDLSSTALTKRLSGGVYPASMNRFHSSDCKNIWDEPSWARQYCVFSRVCPYNQYPVLASLLKKSFRKFWGLDFPLEILQGWFWSPVGFLKENQDFKIFENFFSTSWATVDIGYKGKPLKLRDIVSLKMAHLKYFCNRMSGTYSSRQGIPPPA